MRARGPHGLSYHSPRAFLPVQGGTGEKPLRGMRASPGLPEISQIGSVLILLFPRQNGLAGAEGHQQGQDEQQRKGALGTQPGSGDHITRQGLLGGGDDGGDHGGAHGAGQLLEGAEHRIAVGVQLIGQALQAVGHDVADGEALGR